MTPCRQLAVATSAAPPPPCRRRRRRRRSRRRPSSRRGVVAADHAAAVPAPDRSAASVTRSDREHGCRRHPGQRVDREPEAVDGGRRSSLGVVGVGRAGLEPRDPPVAPADRPDARAASPAAEPPGAGKQTGISRSTPPGGAHSTSDSAGPCAGVEEAGGRRSGSGSPSLPSRDAGLGEPPSSSVRVTLGDLPAPRVAATSVPWRSRTGPAPAGSPRPHSLRRARWSGSRSGVR